MSMMTSQSVGFGYGLVIISVHLMLSLMAAQIPDIDNGIIGDPEVECGSDNVEMRFRTRNQFRGKTFVKGHYVDPQCKVDYATINTTSNSSTILINIPHGACDMQRQRMISPHGMQMSTVIIISFHPVFITGIDRAYNVRCAYREEEKTVSTGLEVSALTTASLTQTFPMPTCTYTIRKDEIDGEILKYATVGQQVVHRWQCDTDVFGILVHSCYVEDGQGEKVFIVDEQGCHRDRYILGDPTYVEQLNMAYRESHVFKFADRLTVRFKCQIRLCVKFDDGCRGITPPICASPTNQQEPATSVILGNSTDDTIDERTSNSNSSTSLNESSRALDDPIDWNGYLHLRQKRSSSENSRRTRNHRWELIDGDFISQDLYVLENDESPDEGPLNGTEQWPNIFQSSPTISSSNPPGGVCMSLPAFSSLITCVLLVIMSATLAGFYVIFQQACKKQSDSITNPHLRKI